MNNTIDTTKEETQKLLIYARNIIVEMIGRQTPAKQQKYEIALANMAQVLANNACYLSSHHESDYSEHPFFSKLSYTVCMDIEKLLIDGGWAEIRKGYNSFYDYDAPKGVKMTELRATEKFKETELYKAAYHLTLSPVTIETDYSRDKMEKREIMSYDTVNEFFNDKDSTHSIVYNGEPQRIMLRKIFKPAKMDGEGAFEKLYELGGRLYSTAREGNFHFQGLSSDERKRILLDNEEVAQLDFKCLQPHIAYAHLAKVQLRGDAYQIDHNASNRALNKILWMFFMDGLTAWNKLNFAVKAKYDSMDNGEKLFETFHWFVGQSPKFRRDYLQAFITKHSILINAINGFQNPLALIFQAMDGRLIQDIMATLCAYDIPALPVHDEIICKASDAAKVREIMAAEYSRLFGGFKCDIKMELPQENKAALAE